MEAAEYLKRLSLPPFPAEIGSFYSYSVMRPLLLFLTLISICHAGSHQAVAPIDPIPHQKELQFGLSTYILAAGVTGSVGIDRQRADFESSFGDILENLNEGMALSGFASYDKWSLRADYLYMGMGINSSTGLPIYEEIDTNLKVNIFTSLLSYHVWENDEAYINLGLGARLFHLSGDVSLNSSSNFFPDLKGDSSQDIWDGIIAFTGSYQFAPKWSLRFYGDIGSGDSDLTWQTHLSCGYQCNDSLIVLLGLRQVGCQFESGNIDLEIAFSGPQLGVVYTF